jgi:hypothetical protein
MKRIVFGSGDIPLAGAFAPSERSRSGSVTIDRRIY